ncbi:MAG TPA: nucleotidyl transferase AbiEii/AbiGii toxin family protein [Mycobacteriales bacterium]|nr:nucleotidyl transferase AbiEii/AbiGii toxin family protein [Mycobacteriales bacterium]
MLEAAAYAADDHFTVEIERTATPADRLGGSRRFRVITSLAGRPFETFTLDIGDHEPIGTADSVTLPGVLDFAEIAAVTVPAIPLAQQIAEKLHAYTRRYERGRASTRVKDLIDLVLIAELFVLDAAELSRAVEEIFTARATHMKPIAVPYPPTEWVLPFRNLADTVSVTGDLTEGHAIAAGLLDPILQGRIGTGIWRPERKAWS